MSGPYALMPSPTERKMGSIAWGLSIPFPVLGPLVMSLISLDKRFVYYNSMQALFFHLLMGAGFFVARYVTCGLANVLSPIFVVFMIVFSVVGAMAAFAGRVFEPPVTGPIVRQFIRR